MRLKYGIELIVLAALWGASFLFMRVAVPEFGAVALIEIRVLLAGLVLLPVWFARQRASSYLPVRRAWRALLVVGLLNSAIPFVLFAYSVTHITGGYAAILNATAPIWGALVARVWLRERLQTSAAVGLLVGFTGVVVLVSGSLLHAPSGHTLGVSAALFAAVLYGVAANYTSIRLSHVSPLAIATFSQLGAAIALLPLSLFFLPSAPISLHAWLSVLALAVLCTSLAYLMYFRLIAHIGSTRAITVTFLIPVFGMLWGALFIDEHVTFSMVLGTSVILLGTALVTGVMKIRAPKFGAS